VRWLRQLVVGFRVLPGGDYDHQGLADALDTLLRAAQPTSGEGMDTP
jgi:hypothetical protein